MAFASEAALLEVLEADLRMLSAEARRTDGNFATQITGWLQHTDYGQIKESAERAVLRLRAIGQDGGGVPAVRQAGKVRRCAELRLCAPRQLGKAWRAKPRNSAPRSKCSGLSPAETPDPAAPRATPQEVLRPFLLVCESRNPRLVGLALGSLQKLLAHDAASAEGRGQVLAALLQVEKSGDETVKLKILQTALTLLQSPSALDDEVRMRARARARMRGARLHAVIEFGLGPRLECGARALGRAHAARGSHEPQQQPARAPRERDGGADGQTAQSHAPLPPNTAGGGGPDPFDMLQVLRPRQGHAHGQQHGGGDGPPGCRDHV
jgi:hypothetical protein